MRHAKSSWDEPGLDDRERPLARRGKRDVPRIAAHLVAKGVAPDAIVASPARRARATARRLARGLGFPRAAIVTLEALYAFDDGAGVVTALAGLDDAWDCVIAVGHDPSLTAVANRLGRLALDHVPTCGVVAIELDQDSWRELGRTSSRCAYCAFPKEL